MSVDQTKTKGIASERKSKMTHSISFIARFCNPSRKHARYPINKDLSSWTGPNRDKLSKTHYALDVEPIF